MFKSHQLQDRATAVCTHAKCAISAQDTDIVKYISSMTLTDKVSGVLKHQGSHLWSKSNPDPADLETLMQGLSLHSPESSSPLFTGSPLPDCHNQKASSSEPS
jgi:hypothetical protein